MPRAAFAVMNWLLGAEIEAYGMGVGTECTVVSLNQLGGRIEIAPFSPHKNTFDPRGGRQKTR